MKEYSTSEYEVKIGDPVVDAEVKATSTSVAIPCAAIPDGEYLISLEINGTSAAHRDTFSFASGSCTVGDYTLAYSSYAVTVSTTSNNDVVRLKVEPVEVYVTDAMKAAVVKVSPPSPAELPPITAADIGKVAMVVGETSKGAVIVPEQSVNVVQGPPTQLSNTVGNLFVAGAKVIMTVDGVEYSATVEDVGGTVRAIYSGDGIYINFNRPVSKSNVLISGPNGTHTVSVNIEDSSVEWEAQTPGGGVLVLHLGDGNALDKTWAEIDAVDVAVIVLRRSEDGVTAHLRELVTATTIDSDGKYYVGAGDNLTFQTNTADGYPTLGQ